jgi:poly(beta-D-mannuronate) lyase
LGIRGSGSSNRIDHNIFQNKPTRGTFLLVLGEGGHLVRDTIIDHNQFLNQSYAHGNGGECARIGNSALGPSPGGVVIEYNTFEHCNGDWEAVTIKSSNNIIRYNTFQNNEGSLTFRHGNSNTADGNIFIGGNNGIRVYGHDHRIINNYFANNTGQISSLLGPIVIGIGTVPVDLSASNTEYSQPKNILIAHNTLNDNHAGILIGYGEGDHLPEKIIVANNIITASEGRLVEVLDGVVTFKNNIFFPTGSATIGDVPSSGYANVNPQLTNRGKITSPSDSSPAIDAIPSSEAFGVTTDVDGQTRSGMFDTGADELV